jgi:hypothetical protein
VTELKVTGNRFGKTTATLLELDALVATHVLGWTEVAPFKQVHAHDPILQGVRPGVIASPYTGYKPRVPVPNYSRDIAAAWEVLEKVRGPGVEVRLFSGGWKAGWTCEVGSLASTTRETAPLAICLAALEAVGVQVK